MFSFYAQGWAEIWKFVEYTGNGLISLDPSFAKGSFNIEKVETNLVLESIPPEIEDAVSEENYTEEDHTIIDQLQYQLREKMKKLRISLCFYQICKNLTQNRTWYSNLTMETFEHFLRIDPKKVSGENLLKKGNEILRHLIE